MIRNKFLVYALKKLKKLKATKVGGYLYTRVIPQKTILVKCGKHRLYIDGKDEGLSPYLYLKGKFESPVVKVLKEFIKPGMSVVDLGAHIGYMTLIMADLVGENGKVYAFEPNPKNFELLKLNSSLNNYKNIILINKAVSNKTGQDVLKMDYLNSGAHSLNSLNVPNFKGDEVCIDTVSLDDYFNGKNIDFIKMDVQGWEGQVLRGAKSVLKRRGILILMEFWPQAIQNTSINPAEVLRDLVNKYNFDIRIIDNKDKLLNTDEKMIMDYCNKNVVPSFLTGKMKGEVNLLLQKKA